MPTQQNSATEHIEAIRQVWLSTPSEAAADMANALNDIVHSIFGEPERIGYELLQNADDAAITPGLSVDVQFYLLREYLVIRHNGLHFTPGNVKALCRYGARSNETTPPDENEKQLDLQKIGYKGIGFKSVFNIADRVWVMSGDFTFRFDKHHWSGTPMPWQIVPVFTAWEELPKKTGAVVYRNWVNFVLEIKDGLDRQNIRRRLATIFQQENTILFLRHTRCLELLYEDNAGVVKSFRKLVRSSEQPVFILEKYDNGNLNETTRWHVTTFPVPVPSDARASLAHLNKRLCPEKLKTAEEIEISFAAKLREDNAVVPLATAVVFSYLPTEKRYEFPFLVNSNFLMNEARTELLNEKWNEFLFEQIGYHQFRWFRQMADSTDFRFEFASLLVKYADTNREPRNRSLNAGVQRAQHEIAFVPVLKSGELKKAPETIVDKTRVSDGLAEHNLVRESFEGIRYEIADPRIKRIDRLLSVGAAKFDPQKLRDAIRRGRRFATVPDNMRLLRFLHKKLSGDIEQGERSEWLQTLQETPFLLDQSEALREPRELYFPAELLELPFELPMAFLHQTVFEEVVAGDAPLRAWLEKLGLVFPKPLEIIRRGIYALIENEQVGRGNAVAIGRYVFKHQSGLTSDDFQVLSQLPLLTSRNSLRKAGLCYLSNVFGPRLPLEDLLDEDIFVSKEYLSEGDEPAAWNRFLSKIHARQDMELVLFDNSPAIDAKLKSDYGEYFDFLTPHLPQYDKNKPQRLITLLMPRYLQYADRFDFSMKYWDILLSERWRELAQKSSKAKFKHSIGEASIPSYFQFLVQTKPYFPATDGKCYPTPLVCSSALASLVGAQLPVSTFELSPPQEKLLGIRSELTLDDCLGILNELASRPQQLDKGRITALYQYMLARRFQPEDFAANPLFGKGFQLLAVNNSFQPLGDLRYLHVPRFAEKSDSPHFVFLDLPDEEAADCCKMFGLQVVELEGLELSSTPFQGTLQSNEFPLDWRAKLPYIATVSAARKGSPFSEEYQRLEALSDTIEFKPCSSLQLTYHKDGALIYKREVQAWRSGNFIHYLHEWQDVRTLYDLQEVLATCFEIEGCERELGLLLSIKTELIPPWLSEQGYAVAEAFEVTKELENEVIPSPDLPSGAVVKTTVQAAGTKPFSIIKSNSPKPAQSPISQTAAEAIGKWGEAYVREKGVIEAYYQTAGIAITLLEWVNEMAESGSPFDFLATLEDGTFDYWEIKSTPSPNKAEYPISGNEFQHALQNEGHYFIIRILAAGTAMPDCKILEEPVQLIREGSIRVNNMKMEVMAL